MVTGLSQRQTLTVLYDRDCGICTGVARALVRLDSGSQLRLEALQTWSSPGSPTRSELESVLHVVDERGRWFTGGQAAVEIARRLPALRPVALAARVPGSSAALEFGYRLVAAHRHELSALLGLRVCPVPNRHIET